MTKATKRTLGVICLLWLGTLLLLFANYKTKVYLEQLRSQVDGVTQQEQANATAVKRQPSRTMEDVLVRTDAQLVTTSFSNENYAAKAKSLVSLCDKELKEKTGGVSNESVQAEMQRRPGINGDSDLLYADGSSATMGGGTLMYTCNGANYHDVTLTFWR